MSRDARALFILAGLVLATSLPFVHRAYFVDDYYFVTMAKGILANPTRPYDFKSDDAGIGNVAWERGQRPRMVNPPLFHYFLAGVIAVAGDEPWKLRTASLIFSFIALACMYFLGRRFVPDPLASAVLMALCPAYWLTSYSLLIDSALIAFVLAGLLAYVVAHEKKSVIWILVSGLIMGFAMLVKYFGVIVIFLAFAWQMLDGKRRRWTPGYFVYVLFLGVQLLWAYWNIQTYGQSHFLAALPRGMNSFSLVASAQKGLVLGSFLGGGLIFILASYVMLWRASKAWLAAMLALGGILFALFYTAGGGFDKLQSSLLTFFITGTFCFLILAGRTLEPAKKSTHAFLALWIFLGVAELVIAMPWTAGRYLMCVLPAIAWVFTLEAAKWGSWNLWRSTVTATAIAGLIVAHGDYRQANTIVSLSDQLARKQNELEAIAPRPQNKWYYLADTFDGSQPYLEPLGWQNILPHQHLHKGDLFMRAYYRKSSWWNVDEELKKFRPVYTIDVVSRNPVRVMDVPASAGFYASCWGALPWTVTNHPLERYELYQAVSE